MKLSKRERALIGILIIVLIIYTGYKLIPTPNFFNLESLKAEYNLKTVEYNNMSKNILLKSKYEEKLQDLSEEINNIDLIADLQQENIIVFLNHYLADNNISVSSMTFTELTPAPINVDAVSKQSRAKSSLEIMMEDINEDDVNYQNQLRDKLVLEDNQSRLEDDDLTVKLMTVNIVFESTYENMLKFIDTIQNNPYEISITNIDTVSRISEDVEVIQGNMVLNFYEVPKLDTFIEQNTDWIWKD